MSGRTKAILSLACLVVSLPAAIVACGTSGTDTTSSSPATTAGPVTTVGPSTTAVPPTTAPSAAGVLTVEQALAAGEGQPINVQGSIFATNEQIILASAMAESYPPQPGGAKLPVEGLDLGSLVGLTSTAGEPGLADVTWSDYWVVLTGAIQEGVLQVQGTPTVVETSKDDLTVRFSPVCEPISSGDPVWWAFDVTNMGQIPVDLAFTSGQRGEVVLSQDGIEKYRWGDGKAFTEAIETVTLQPGESLSVVLNDTLGVAPGDYDLVARLTATVGSGGTALPDLVTVLKVH